MKKLIVQSFDFDSDLEKPGYITEENLELLDEKEKVTMYFTHSHNLSLKLFIVPKVNIKTLVIPSTDVMKFIVSAGLISWKKA